MLFEYIVFVFCCRGRRKPIAELGDCVDFHTTPNDISSMSETYQRDFAERDGSDTKAYYVHYVCMQIMDENFNAIVVAFVPEIISLYTFFLVRY